MLDRRNTLTVGSPIMQITDTNDLRVVVAYILNEIFEKKVNRKETRRRVYQALDKDEILKRFFDSDGFGNCEHDIEQEIIDANNAFGEIVGIWGDLCPSYLKKISISSIETSLKKEPIPVPSFQKFKESWNRIKSKIDFTYDDTASSLETYFFGLGTLTLVEQ